MQFRGFLRKRGRRSCGCFPVEISPAPLGCPCPPTPPPWLGNHPHGGYPGEIPELKTDCECRKPKPGMIRQAAADFNIDIGQSWMAGDGERDIGTGKAAGCRTALIGGGDFGQDMTAGSLKEFTEKAGIAAEAEIPEE